MHRLYLFLVILFILTNRTFAQRDLINGYIKDSITLLPVSGGTVTNIHTKKSTRTDDRGFFSLEANPGDVLQAYSKNYKFDTLRYSVLMKDTVTIFLVPSGDILEPVTVESGYSRYQLDSISRRKDFEEIRGTTLSKVDKSRNSGFGLAINLDAFFKSKYKHKKRDERNFNRTEREIYIDYRFPPQLVSMYTGLKGDELLRFMRLYRPSYEWLRQHPSREQVVYYISDRLKAFRSLKK
jgi:hypothetical protein